VVQARAKAEQETRRTEDHLRELDRMQERKRLCGQMCGEICKTCIPGDDCFYKLAQCFRGCDLPPDHAYCNY
jgi:hypothetical protein